MLVVKDLRVQFSANQEAVKGINFTLAKGEKLGIVGESGSGKSVTALALMGLLPNNAKVYGKVTLKDESRNILTFSEAECRSIRGKQIAMIFQDPMSALNPLYTIGFQLAESIKTHFPDKSHLQVKKDSIQLLRKVKLLSSEKILKTEHQALDNKTSFTDYLQHREEELLSRYPHQLSGGQLQRVMIAMAISCNPEILIADEPTTALDVTVQATILNLLKELCQEQNMGLIFITHDLGVVAQLVDRVMVMYQGKIQEIGKKEEVLYRPSHPYTQALVNCRPRLGQTLSRLPIVSDYMEIQETETGEQILVKKTAMVNLGENNQVTITPTISEDILLSVSNLHVQFPVKGMFGFAQQYFPALKGITFEVKSGETLGIVGESGCGKSTLAKTILKLIQAYAGQISFRNQRVDISLSAVQLKNFRREVQIIFQNPLNALDPRMTIESAIAEPLEIYHWKGKKERVDRVEYLMKKVSLDLKYKKSYPHQLSGGQRQRVCIARALALHPQLIICDESVSALDVSTQAEVLNLLKELQETEQLTYLFISHDLSVVQFMSNRIMVMNQGQIEEIGTATEIYQNPQSPYTQKLLQSIPQF